MQIIKPDPVLIENAKAALRILETCAKAAATALSHSSFPAVLVPEGDGAKVRPLEPGEIIEVPAPGSKTDACLNEVGGEVCIKAFGHEGKHASTRQVWSKP